jgi:hypothetical protein
VFDGHGGEEPVVVRPYTRAWHRLAFALAFACSGHLVLSACRVEQESRRNAAEVQSPCPAKWTRLPGTFSFEKFNEWHTARMQILACEPQVTGLADSDRRALMAFFRAAAEERKDDWPFAPCGKRSQVPSLATRANRILKGKQFVDICFEVTADIS